MQRYFLVVLIIFGYSEVGFADRTLPEPPIMNQGPPTPAAPSAAASAGASTAVSGASSANNAEIASGDGQGNVDIEAQISKDCALLKPYPSSIDPTSVVGVQLGKMVEACGAFVGSFGISQGLCINTQAGSSAVCLRSELLNNANIGIQLLGSVGSMAIQDSCSTIAKVMDISKNAFSLYSMACNAARATCTLKCGSIVEKVKTFKAVQSTTHAALSAQLTCTQVDMSKAAQEELRIAIAIAAAGSSAGGEPTVITNNGIAACQTFIASALTALSSMGVNLDRELLVTDRKSVAGKLKTCEADFGNMVASAGASALSLLASYAQAQKCEQQTKAAQAAQLNCDDPKNKNIPDCICQKSPRSEGCANSLVKASGSLNAASSTSSVAQASVPKLGERSVASETPLGKDPATAGGKSASSGSVGGAQAGAPVGGSGGGGGAGGSDGRGSGGKETPTFGRGSRFSTNVNSGYDGGGSGGFRRGGFSSEAEAKVAYENYKKNRDPVKVAAQAWAKEVSPQNGRSNFEKIKSRYNDNRRTLIGK